MFMWFGAICLVVSFADEFGGGGWMLLVRDGGAICGDCCFAMVWLEMLRLLVLDCCFEFFVLIVLVTCGACVRLVVWACCMLFFVVLNCLGLLVICLVCGVWLIVVGFGVLLCGSLLFGLFVGVGYLVFCMVLVNSVVMVC